MMKTNLERAAAQLPRAPRRGSTRRGDVPSGGAGDPEGRRPAVPRAAPPRESGRGRRGRGPRPLSAILPAVLEEIGGDVARGARIDHVGGDSLSGVGIGPGAVQRRTNGMARSRQRSQALCRITHVGYGPLGTSPDTSKARRDP